MSKDNRYAAARPLLLSNVSLVTGPPCPPCVVNEARDYQPGDALTLSDATRNRMEVYMNQYLSYWPEHMPPTRNDHGSSIVEGAAGRGLIFLRMYNYTRNETHLALAAQYIDAALKELRNDNVASYFGGS